MPYVDPITPVSSRYGAPMGRPSRIGLASDAGRLYLRRVPLNGGGYDAGGAYWGLGAPLWVCMDQDGETYYLRARTRAAAKAEITAEMPDARFYK